MKKQKKIAVTFLIDPHMNKTFDIICKNKDLPKSVVLRQLIDKFNKNNSQLALDK